MRGSSVPHDTDGACSHLISIRLEYQNGSCMELIACAGWHLGNQLGLLNRVPQFSSFYLLHGLGCSEYVAWFQRGVSEAEKLETAAIFSLILKASRCHFFHILLAKTNHRASPDSMWEWFTQGVSTGRHSSLGAISENWLPQRENAVLGLL